MRHSHTNFEVSAYLSDATEPFLWPGERVGGRADSVISRKRESTLPGFKHLAPGLLFLYNNNNCLLSQRINLVGALCKGPDSANAVEGND